MGLDVPDSAAVEHGAVRDPQFALAKFKPSALPATLVARQGLRDRLTAAARPAGLTSWLSCDEADADPVRFWAGFIEALRAIEPVFGRDAADLLAMDRQLSADAMASIANDAAKLPGGSAIVVDDFHLAASAVARQMTDLVEHWPAEMAQLVLAGRFDPPLRLHRLRMSAELCEVRDSDLYFSLAESRDLLANFGVQVSDGNLALLHQRSEGWPVAVQMAALSLRSTAGPALSSVLQLMVYATVLNINGGVALFPLQLLFCKFFVVITVVIGFIVDVPDPGVMQRPPRKSGTKIVTRPQIIRWFVTGFVIAATALCVLEWGPGKPSTTHASVNMTMAFAIVSLSAVNIGLVMRRERQAPWSSSVFPYLGWIILGWILTWAAVDKVLQFRHQRMVQTAPTAEPAARPAIQAST